MKWLCIDYGLQRTGIAVSDPEGRMAFPRITLQKTTRDKFFADLLQVIASEGVQGLVVGLPVDLNGAETLITRQVRNMAGSLRRKTDLPIYFMEEILSSAEAEQDLRDSGLHGQKLKAVLDQQAAVRILESFLAQSEQQRSVQ